MVSPAHWLQAERCIYSGGMGCMVSPAVIGSRQRWIYSGKDGMYGVACSLVAGREVSGLQLHTAALDIWAAATYCSSHFWGCSYVLQTFFRCPVATDCSWLGSPVPVLLVLFNSILGCTCLDCIAPYTQLHLSLMHTSGALATGMHAELHAAHWPTAPTLSLTLHSIPQFVGHSYWLHLPMRVTAATTCTRTQYTSGDITAPHRVPLPPAGQNYRLPTSSQGDLVHWRYHCTTQGLPATCWAELQAAHQLAG
jgi:hypothetical protein